MIHDAALVRLAVAAAGAALAVLAIAPAVAADGLPRRASAPVQDSCSAIGPGFHKVAGSDTCIRLGGSVEVGASVSTGSGTAGAWMSRAPRR